MSENSARFRASKDNRNLRRAFGALKIDELEFALKHLLIKEEQRTQSLILR
jgi:hypothetical protein